MPTAMTLDGTKPGAFKRLLSRVGLGDDRGQWLGDAWSDDAAAVAPENPVADFTKATFGWGVLAFALGTAGIRGYQAVRDRMPAKPVAGARRRRRR